MSRPAFHTDPEPIVDAVLEHTGGRVVLGLPLGVGKSPAIANALYRRAEADRSISLRILTALTLEPPQPKGDLERRFLGPINDRVFAGWPRLAYADALHAGDLPPNIEVSEFFFHPGQWLGSPEAQRKHISANYTHVPSLLRRAGVNVIAHIVAPGGEAGDGYSLSCNPEITLEIADLLRARGGPCLMIGQTNGELPFMPGQAVLPAGDFDHLLEGHEFPLFAPPNGLVSDGDHAIGIRAAALVPDGGTLQIGIGSIGDAFGAALVMRHRAPKLFRETLERLGRSPYAPAQTPETEPFSEGLFGCSEMVVPSFLELYEAGILKRRAADGAVLHGAFFVGPRDFYRRLREMPEEERARFSMRPISWVNALYGDEDRKRADRSGARFVNNAMVATLLGEFASDTLEDGRVVSGVGGQYNMVAQAFALGDARSIIALNARRTSRGRERSNIRWRYGATTVPRHLRDIVVTEHGMADLRGRSDADCVAAMISVAAPRFREELRNAAGRKAGAVAEAPERDLAEALAPAKREGWCREFPFGTDLTPVEQRLTPALARVARATANRAGLGRSLVAAARVGSPDADERAALERLGLDRPDNLRERAMRRLVLRALRQESAPDKGA